MSVTADRALDAGHAALTRATRHLLSLQQPGGWWKGELETNVTIDAEDLFLRHYLGLLDERVAAPTATWIRSRQRPDGSWATYYGGPGDLSTSVEAYVALRLAGDPPDAAHMARAAAFIRDAGGVGQSRVFTRMWLSLLGLWSWGEVPTLPPEQILLPPRAPLSVYSFGCWARQTIVALSVVTALRPAAAVPFAIDELRAGASRARPGRRRLGAGVRPLRPGRPHLRPASRSAPPPARAPDGRALDRRPPGEGRLLGRHPAAVGVVDRRPARARLPARPPGARARPRRPRHVHDRATTRAAGSRPASRRSGTRPSR